MAKTPVIYFVGTSVPDGGDEAAFNEWYNKTHVPEVLCMPGMKSGTRYEILVPEEGYPKFLAMYEVDGEEGYQDFLEHRRKQEAGEIPTYTPGPPFQVIWRKAYRRIGP